MTNSEVLRSMTDKELAEQLTLEIVGLHPCTIYLSAPTGKMFILRMEAVKATMEWLLAQETE